MNTSRTLDHLMPGQTARVRRVGSAGALRRRLLDMGLVRGAEIEMLKRAPLGDPIEYRVRGYHLSLRQAEARMIEIEA